MLLCPSTPNTNWALNSGPPHLLVGTKSGTATHLLWSVWHGECWEQSEMMWCLLRSGRSYHGYWTSTAAPTMAGGKSQGQWNLTTRFWIGPVGPCFVSISYTTTNRRICRSNSTPGQKGLWSSQMTFALYNRWLWLWHVTQTVAICPSIQIQARGCTPITALRCFLLECGLIRWPWHGPFGTVRLVILGRFQAI